MRFRVRNTSSLVILTADYVNTAVFCNARKCKVMIPETCNARMRLIQRGLGRDNVPSGSGNHRTQRLHRVVARRARLAEKQCKISMVLEFGRWNHGRLAAALLLLGAGLYRWEQALAGACGRQLHRAASNYRTFIQRERSHHRRLPDYTGIAPAEGAISGTFHCAGSAGCRAACGPHPRRFATVSAVLQPD